MLKLVVMKLQHYIFFILFLIFPSPNIWSMVSHNKLSSPLDGPVEKREAPNSKQISYIGKASGCIINVSYNPNEKQNIYSATMFVPNGHYMELKFLDNGKYWFELLEQAWLLLQNKPSE